MISGTNPISNNNSLLSNSSTDSLLSALGGSTSFDSIFTQAMNQAKTPAAKMQDALLEVQYNDLNALYNAVSGDSSDDSSDPLLSSSTDSLALDLGSVSSQVSQLEQELGITPSTSGTSSSSSASSASNMNAALGLQAQMLLNNDLANFGSSSDSSSGIDSLV